MKHTFQSAVLHIVDVNAGQRVAQFLKGLQLQTARPFLPPLAKQGHQRTGAKHAMAKTKTENWHSRVPYKVFPQALVASAKLSVLKELHLQRLRAG